MNAEQLIKLIDAGFTKEDILSLAHSASPSTTAENVPEQPQPSAPEAAPPTEEPKSEAPDISKMIEDKITEVFEPFKDLYTNMAKMVGMPSMQDVQPKGIEDIISDFFKGE
jgi:hypothetical protein